MRTTVKQSVMWLYCWHALPASVVAFLFAVLKLRSA